MVGIQESSGRAFKGKLFWDRKKNIKLVIHGNLEAWWEAHMEKATLLALTFVSLFGKFNFFADFSSVL